MHISLLFLSFFIFIVSIKKILSLRSSARIELTLFFIIGIFLAYPIKTFLLNLDATTFITYELYKHNEYRLESYYLFIIFIILFMLGYITAKKSPISHYKHAISSFFSVLNLINSIVLLLVVINFSSISSFNELLSPTARKAFLASQQGNGWSSLLFIFSIPFMVLAYLAGKRFLFYISFIFTLFALLIIGSRTYLFGYLLSFIVMRSNINIIKATLIISIFGVLSIYIYMGFLGDSIENVSLMQSLSFVMYTFDGADILNTYFEKPYYEFYYGYTVIEDLIITYIPRALFEEKPFLFGAIRITGDVFQNTADVQEQLATFPPGILLEIIANFGPFAIFIFYIFGYAFRRISDKNILRNPFFFTFYVSLFSVSPQLFRGIGSIISYTLPIIILLYLLSFIQKVMYSKNSR